MATYAIGDIQGCYAEFEQLIQKIAFNPSKDYLWLVGDLVNRGPESLAVLRKVKSLGNAAITVLGNHDLHMLAVAAGVADKHHSDTFDDILQAPDRDELLNWLRQQRLIYVDGEFVLLHAGLMPQWTIAQAQQLANEVEKILRGDEYVTLLKKMYGNKPDCWEDDLVGYDRLRVITNSFSRMRICSPKGEMQFKFKGELSDVPQGYLPWYEVPGRRSLDKTVIFGHWSALGLVIKPKVIALDTGCLWGGPLTAIRLEDRQVFQVSCSRANVAKEW